MAGFCVCALASGSKGNCVYVSDGLTSILVDSGFSGIEIERRMKSVGLSPKNLDGIVVSHEHLDHIQGVGVLARRFGLPVYMSAKTAEAASSRLGKIDVQRNFQCGFDFPVKTLSIHPFSIPHDATDPAGFTINKKIGIATDLGFATSMVKEHLKTCELLVIEANHDPKMLMNGPYPWFLKQRVKSRTGHLSNSDSKELIREIRHDGLAHVILAHLSETNNTTEKALSEVGLALDGCKTRLSAAKQDQCGNLYYI